MSVTGE